MLPAANDTLSCDVQRLEYWLNNADYDYARALSSASDSWYERLRYWLAQHLYDWFHWTLTDEDMNWLFIGFAILCVLALVVYIWRKHPSIFRRVKPTTHSGQEEEDTIYGIDFEEQIQNAVKTEDFYSAIRYTYLYTLKQLNDQGLINWQPYKAPTEYVYELKKTESVKELRRITADFMRVRYGNFKASASLYEQVENCCARLCRQTGQEGGDV